MSTQNLDDLKATEKPSLEEIIEDGLYDKEQIEQPRTKRSIVKRLLPRTLLGRSLLILVTPILLVQVISTIVFLDNHWGKIMDRLAYAVAGEITVIARSIEDGITAENLKRVTGYSAQNLGLLMSYEDGEAIKDKDFSGTHAIWESVVVDTLERELRDQLRRPFYIHADFQEKWVEVNIQLQDGVLNVILPERRLFSSSGYIFLIWMFSTSLILSIVAVLFMRNQIRPIRRLAVAADWFGRGRDVQKFKVEGASEVRQAGQAFLDMRRRIKRQISQRTIMLAGVSHDLRTPLTRMKLELEMMKGGSDIQAMKDDVMQMQRMIDGYLKFVRGGEGESSALVNLSSYMEKIQQKTERLSKPIQWDIPEYIQLPLRPLAFERALMNIINNACKYAENVWVKAELGEEERVYILVEDDGPGIDGDKYKEVFKPFYRIDEARSADTGGVGLGMPIAMDIIHSHGGKIWLAKSDKGGLKVVIRLPM